MTTPRGAPELAAAQALPETTVNEQIRRTEAGAGRFAVADRVTAPPGSCADGAVYLIISAATGDFAGKEDQLATAVGANAASGWLYRVPGTLDEGIVAYVQDENADYLWDGSAWGTYAPSPTITRATTITQSGNPAATSVGYMGSPVLTTLDSGNVAPALADSGKTFYHTDANARDFTIPADASISFPVGTILAIVNEDGAADVSIIITSDTLRWTDQTGTRTLAENGTATLIKVASTVWRLTGDGIT
jgi:hypothetical protein